MSLPRSIQAAKQVGRGTFISSQQPNGSLNRLRHTATAISIIPSSNMPSPLNANNSLIQAGIQNFSHMLNGVAPPMYPDSFRDSLAAADSMKIRVFKWLFKYSATVLCSTCRTNGGDCWLVCVFEVGISA